MINKNRALNHFMELVKIDSESLNEVNVAKHLKEYFEDLGYDVFEDLVSKKAAPNGSTGNIVVKVPGQGTKKDEEAIMLQAHMDTVEPGNGVKPSITDDGKYVVSDGTTILGADDKAGIAQIIEVEHVLRENNLDHPPLEFLFTIAEEIGLIGSFNLDKSLLDAKIAYVLDGGDGPGAAIIGGPDYYDLKGTIKGKAAHAGVAPETGISSIQVLAQAITNMKLLKIDEDTTTNIGKVITDYPTNVVPEITTFEMEVRSLDPDKALAQIEHIKETLAAACETFGAEYDLEVSKSLSYYKHDEDNKVLKLYKDMCERHNLDYRPMVIRGGTDVSGLMANGIDAICLSAGGEFAHELKERLIIDEFIDDIQQLIWLITD
ncbi:MAG TPA: M20/M25/M40 family metallo-hydrolase [Erysipelothrix sp.]|nr:M20/M25/M40 family metallo-hydrolase [Erysipelothrix sp.]